LLYRGEKDIQGPENQSDLPVDSNFVLNSNLYGYRRISRRAFLKAAALALAACVAPPREPPSQPLGPVGVTTIPRGVDTQQAQSATSTSERIQASEEVYTGSNFDLNGGGIEVTPVPDWQSLMNEAKAISEAQVVPGSVIDQWEKPVEEGGFNAGIQSLVETLRSKLASQNIVEGKSDLDRVIIEVVASPGSGGWGVRIVDKETGTPWSSFFNEKYTDFPYRVPQGEEGKPLPYELKPYNVALEDGERWAMVVHNGTPFWFTEKDRQRMGVFNSQTGQIERFVQVQEEQVIKTPEEVAQELSWVAEDSVGYGIDRNYRFSDDGMYLIELRTVNDSMVFLKVAKLNQETNGWEKTSIAEKYEFFAGAQHYSAKYSGNRFTNEPRGDHKAAEFMGFWTGTMQEITLEIPGLGEVDAISLGIVYKDKQGKLREISAISQYPDLPGNKRLYTFFKVCGGIGNCYSLNSDFDYGGGGFITLKTSQEVLNYYQLGKPLTVMFRFQRPDTKPRVIEGAYDGYIIYDDLITYYIYNNYKDVVIQFSKHVLEGDEPPEGQFILPVDFLDISMSREYYEKLLDEVDLFFSNRP